MKHVELNLGLSCNHKCIFCMSWITREKIRRFESKELIEKEISLLSSKWYNSIGFLWWEPTIHPYFLDLLFYAKENNFQDIEVISNASTFHNKKFLLQAIKDWLTRISLSIHSHISKKEEFLSWGIIWILDKKLQSLENIINLYKNWFLKRELSVNVVISKINFREIKDTVLFLYKKWVRSFRINFIQLEWTSTKNYSILALRYEEFLPYLKDILNLANQYNDIRINFESIPWCFSWLDYFDFLKYSEQSIDKEKYKLSRDDIDFITRDIISQKWDRWRVKDYISKCNYCFLKWDCEGIWNRYIDYYKIK